MVRFLATLLLLLQLRPVAVAAATCAMQSRTQMPCEMTAAAGHGSHSGHSTQHDSSAPGCDCQGAPVCATNPGLALPALVRSDLAGTVFVAPLSVSISSPHTSEPTAPPVPPPNA